MTTDGGRQLAVVAFAEVSAMKDGDNYGTAGEYKPCDGTDYLLHRHDDFARSVTEAFE